MNKLILYGKGGFGREVASYLKGRTEFEWGDDKDPTAEHNGESSYSGRDVLVTIGSPGIRAAVMADLKAKGATFRNVVCYGALCFKDLMHDSGIVVCPGSVIATPDSFLGVGVQINTLCMVSHDVVIGNYCTLSPGVLLMGGVSLGDRVFLGTGAKVLPNVSIGAGAIVGAGAVVTQDVAAFTTVVGVPARVR